MPTLRIIDEWLIKTGSIMRDRRGNLRHQFHHAVSIGRQRSAASGGANEPARVATGQLLYFRLCLSEPAARSQGGFQGRGKSNTLLPFLCPLRRRQYLWRAEFLPPRESRPNRRARLCSPRSPSVTGNSPRRGSGTRRRGSGRNCHSRDPSRRQQIADRSATGVRKRCLDRRAAAPLHPSLCAAL